MRFQLPKHKRFLLHYLTLGLTILSVPAICAIIPHDYTQLQAAELQTTSSVVSVSKRDASEWETAMRVGDLLISVSAAALAALTPVACPSTPACLPIVSGLLATICIGAVIDFIGINGDYYIGSYSFNETSSSNSFAFYDENLARSSGLHGSDSISSIVMTTINDGSDSDLNTVNITSWKDALGSHNGDLGSLMKKISKDTQFTFKLRDQFDCVVRYDDNIHKIIVTVI